MGSRIIVQTMEVAGSVVMRKKWWLFWISSVEGGGMVVEARRRDEGDDDGGFIRCWDEQSFVLVSRGRRGCWFEVEGAGREMKL